MVVPTVSSKTITPVDLEDASRSMDVTLPPQPVHVQADALLMRGSDGYARARGNVDMQQGIAEMHTGYMEGNTKTGIYHSPGKAVYISGTNVLTGSDITYNGKNSGAVMGKIDGFVDSQTYIRGTGAEMYDGVGYVQHGLITTPHAVAKTPDYYLTGDDIHIYPGDKFTSEHTSLWFKNVRLLSIGHYEGNLDSTKKRKNWIYTLMPRPTYNNDDGIGLHGSGEFPMSRDGSTHLDVDYRIQSQGGFKPSINIAKDTKVGSFRFGYNTEESTDNDDHIWATKWPELRYYAPRINFGHTGIYVNSSAEWGRWSEDNRKTGGHKGYRTEITHVPIPLWKKANLRFFAGYRRDLYDAYDAERRDPYTGVVLNQGINDHMWTSFWWKKHNVSGYTPYRFDTIDDPRQKGFSIGYVMTPKDTFMFSFARNLDTNDVSDRNWTWIRDLHSFTAVITYKQVEKKWEALLLAKDFD